jgi:uncharacterized small protein (DUF1192 family)
MATPPKAGKPATGDAGPRQRMAYLNIRIAEVRAELARLTAERQSLRATLTAARTGKPGKV